MRVFFPTHEKWLIRKIFAVLAASRPAPLYAYYLSESESFFPGEPRTGYLVTDAPVTEDGVCLDVDMVFGTSAHDFLV